MERRCAHERKRGDHVVTTQREVRRVLDTIVNEAIAPGQTPALPLGCAELPAIDAALAGDGGSRDLQPGDRVVHDGANRALHISRLTGMHCATGVPLGSTPRNDRSRQRAGKLMKLSL